MQVCMLAYVYWYMYDMCIGTGGELCCEHSCTQSGLKVTFYFVITAWRRTYELR